ncbi:MAG: hypothetical protein LBU99_03120 [Spirochaetaceae bacterium]|jgi:hypothetical protein|nr:hypothetical protein [Spirochaetaceae bacterium]
MEIRITDAFGEIVFKPEVNRSFGYCWNVGAQGAAVFNQRFFIQGGLSLGRVGVSNCNCFARVGVYLPIPVDVSLSAAYLFNAFEAYKSKNHSIISSAAIRFKYGGFAAGCSLRVPFYDNIRLPMECSLLVLAYVNPYVSELVNFRLSVSNFHDYFALTTGFYRLRAQFSVKVSRHITIVSGISLYQTGSIGLSATPYGGVLTGGVVFNL